jgi:hypothetical protein
VGTTRARDAPLPPPPGAGPRPSSGSPSSTSFRRPRAQLSHAHGQEARGEETDKPTTRRSSPSRRGEHRRSLSELDLWKTSTKRRRSLRTRGSQPPPIVAHLWRQRWMRLWSVVENYTAVTTSPSGETECRHPYVVSKSRTTPFQDEDPRRPGPNAGLSLWQETYEPTASRETYGSRIREDHRE